MTWLYVLSFLFALHHATAMLTSCNAKFCDPNWTPFDNMVAGLRGYNIRTGNPIHNQGDPGFGAQIFLPTKINAHGRIELEAGITASELTFCHRSMTSRSFTNIESYRKYVGEASSSGVDLQVGTDTEVTAGVNLKGVDLSATKVIPKPFERSWGDSRDFKQLASFFREKHGLISISMGTCILYDLKLDRFLLPPFTDPFKAALTKLFEVKDRPSYIKKAVFRRFIKEYGTHFLLRTKMGAQYIYRSKWSKEARRLFNAETLKACSYKKGAKIFGIQVEESRSKCSNGDTARLRKLASSNYEETIITKGSRPTNIENWATQKFTPVPLQFKLSPIINLMKDKYIKRANLKFHGAAVTSIGIRKWFVPMYFNYCNSMNVDCGEKIGCGIDDKCPVDTICIGGGRTHACSQWSHWGCPANSVRGTTKRRTRHCTGCSGETIQFIANTECYVENPKCIYKYTQWNERNSNAHFLDRHRVDCGGQHFLQWFNLERDSNHKNYRYKYKCCETQYRCRSNTWRNTGRTYIDGGDFVYLDRQHPGCPNNEVMSGFQLRPAHPDHLYYSFRCCSLPQKKSCYHKYTSFSWDGEGNAVYLDRQAPGCKEKYGIAYFRLSRNTNHDHVRYLLKCCKIERY